MEPLRIPSQLNMEAADLDASWRKFRQNFEIYLQARGPKQTEDNQVALFLNIAGEEAVALFNRLGLSLESNLPDIMEAFQNHCCPERSEIQERHRFYTRNQQPKESFQDYLSSLNELIRTCNFPDPNSMLRDRIVMGIHNECLRQTLMRVRTLSSEIAIQLCCAVEAMEENKEDLNKVTNVLNNKPNSSKHMNCKLDFNNLSINNNGMASANITYDEYNKKFRYNKSAGKFQVVEEVNQNLFKMGNEYCLACCTAEDLSLGAGICVEFRKKFGGVEKLLNQMAKTGEMALLQQNGRFIYYLVIKRQSGDIALLVNMFTALERMRDHMLANGTNKLAIPRLGCGYDRFVWGQVKNMLEFIFQGTPIKITVCNFQPNESGGSGYSGYSYK